MQPPALIVLNWNNAPDTLDCLSVLRPLQAAGMCRVWVVDNGSSDDSAEQIARAFPEMCLLQTGANLGYAGGNNVGIRAALTDGAEVVGIVNNDLLLSAETLAALGDLLATHLVDVVTPLIVSAEDPDHVWALGLTIDPHTGDVTRRFADASLHSLPRDAHPVPSVSGAMFLARRAVFERAGLLDDDYFLYYEEVEWSVRVRQAGFRISAEPKAIAHHKVSATLGTSSPLIDYYMLRNHLRFAAGAFKGTRRAQVLSRILWKNLLTIAAYTAKSDHGRRAPHRNARLYALRDALLHRWGQLRPDSAQSLGVVSR